MRLASSKHTSWSRFMLYWNRMPRYSFRVRFINLKASTLLLSTYVFTRAARCCFCPKPDCCLDWPGRLTTLLETTVERKLPCWLWKLCYLSVSYRLVIVVDRGTRPPSLPLPNVCCRAWIGKYELSALLPFIGLVLLPWRRVFFSCSVGDKF